MRTRWKSFCLIRERAKARAGSLNLVGNLQWALRLPPWWSQPDAGFAPAAICPSNTGELAGEPVIRSSLSLFAWHGQIGAVQAVIHPDDRGSYEAAAKGLRLLPPVPGGATRQASVRAGLEALSARAPDIVLVHDAARPFCSAELVSRAIVGLRRRPAPRSRRWRSPTRSSASMPAAMSRARSIARELRAVQTPQAFAFPALLEAHRRAAAEGRDDFTDDAALAEWAGLKVAMFAGESGNVKLTTDEDFAKAEARRIASLADLRLGNGFDVHAFGDGDHVWLGGVKIPHDRGLTGHSDADVALHALVDAILGALADGDIGKHFSPNDPRWRGASSDQFLKFAVERVTKRGGRIAHLDSPSSARRRGSGRTATRCESASPRSPTCRSSAWR